MKEEVTKIWLNWVSADWPNVKQHKEEEEEGGGREAEGGGDDGGGEDEGEGGGGGVVGEEPARPRISCLSSTSTGATGYKARRLLWKQPTFRLH